MDQHLLTFRCLDESKAFRAVGDMLSHLSGDTRDKIMAMERHFLIRDDGEGLYELINNKTVGEVLDAWTPIDSPQPILTGERDGLKFALYESLEDEGSNTKGVWTALFDCQFGRAGVAFYADVARRLQRLGVTFYRDDDYPASMVDDPAAEIIANELPLFSFAVSHPCFASSERSACEIEKDPPWYMSGKLPQSFMISSTNVRNEPDNADVIQELALGQSEFLRLIIPEFQPTLALADQCCLAGGLKVSSIEDRKLPRLYWMTFFGSEYVAEYGLNFLMKIPAWRTEEFAGGVLVTVTEKYLDFATNEPEQSLKYLRHTFPQIIANRFVP